MVLTDQVLVDGRARTRAAGHERPPPVVEETSTLDGMFSRAALRKPAAIALQEGPHLLTYGKAEARAVQLATALVRGGVQLGDPVIVHCESHAQALLAQLAVLKAGGVCVPVAPGTDAALVERVARISGARTALCSRSTQPVWAGRAACLVLDAEEAWSKIGALRVDRALPRSEPTGAAYLLVDHGDGPVGGGQLVDHRAWGLALAARVHHVGRVTSTVRTSQLPLGAPSLSAMWWAFRCGGAVRVPPAGGGADTAGAFGSAVAVFGPREYRLVLEAARQAPRPARPRVVVLLGGPCPDDLADLHFEVLPTTRLWAEFAPAGGAVPWATRELPPGHRTGGTGIAVGRPVPRAHVRILGPDGRLVPTGLAGEVCATGPALPFDSIPAPRWGSPVHGGGAPLRSGRLGRWRPDGVLEITGTVGVPGE
ncbi:hypothetical protein AR457_29470 [Streptomyces agglomeratus]|uniref:AMP-binding protein n=1 Tax=Streptomyces agglomeratus TaxID=285458 RepID=UPI000854A2F4|nr:AMP-binding protein [Streptomyces agglomeratus]OEJ37950.1 hypothetical protein BGK70_07180 [Streptomyces agglomeratus]OEJ47668.1 hypothetical protein AR457_29470 [Streptomyces agglomeratus]OEJ50478.1 hypothetical protein BGK72_06655 [Streptomyces agglomeratus]OEJ57830.1 hypothetical protein BGM19_07470 [Streptomyces agglomeratus]